MASRLSEPTLKRLEAVADGAIGSRADEGEKLVAALESAGVELIAENSGLPGVQQ